ncbi:MAG: hypothetical protein AYK23_00670 [Candidatus Proteinoplasmatales archaeon SG8-5]|nr:MAG: hypothetical protein AYK23_00670 [Candidatus Proteinoplasmatales archaeon SG8-5]
MLSLDDFEPLKLEHKEIFERIYANNPPRHSETVFTTLVSWLHYVDVKFIDRDDHLLISTEFEDEVRLRPPIGRPNADSLNDIIELAKANGRIRSIVGIEEPTKEWISGIHPDLKFQPNRDYYDYVYLASDLAELAGKNYLKIRNRLNRYNRKYEHTVEPIAASNFDEVMTFIRKWCLWRDCASNQMLENERIAVMYSMDNFFELCLSGIAIRMNHEIEAISVYEEMNPETAVIHIEKAMPDFDGIYQAINNEAAKTISSDYRYINRESDLGIRGLREAKKRYHPHHMEKIYFVKRENLLKV